MVDTINCPPLDRFQLITEHPKENYLYAATYLDINHTDALIIIQITLNEGRTVDLKKALYKAIAEGLHTSVGVKPQDVFVNLLEVKKENWSFGNGVAQYAT